MTQKNTNRIADSTTLADLLERVLDKGIVVSGDIRINLVDIELLSIKIQLVVCSIDKAKEIGIDWWNNKSLENNLDKSHSELTRCIKELNQRIIMLEEQSISKEPSDKI